MHLSYFLFSRRGWSRAGKAADEGGEKAAPAAEVSRPATDDLNAPNALEKLCVYVTVAHLSGCFFVGFEQCSPLVSLLSPTFCSRPRVVGVSTPVLTSPKKAFITGTLSRILFLIVVKSGAGPGVSYTVQLMWSQRFRRVHAEWLKRYTQRGKQLANGLTLRRCGSSTVTHNLKSGQTSTLKHNPDEDRRGCCQQLSRAQLCCSESDRGSEPSCLLLSSFLRLKFSSTLFLSFFFSYFLVQRQKWTLKQVSRRRSQQAKQLGATRVAQMCTLWSLHSVCEIFLFLHLCSSSSPLLPKYLTLSLNNWIHCWVQGEVCTSLILPEDSM